jgi:hypothetical protein
MDDPSTRADEPTPVAETQPVEAPPSAGPPPDPVTSPPDPVASPPDPAASPPDPVAPPPEPAWLGASQPTASGPSPRQLLIGAALVLGIILLTVAVGATLLKASKGDSYEAIAAEVGGEILAEPGFKAKYGTVTTEQGAFDLGQQVARQGVGRLGDADLLRYWQASNKMLQAAPEAICGRILRQTATAADASAAAKAVDTQTFRDLADVLLLAVRADLRGDAAVPAPSTEQVTAAFLALRTAMGPSMLQAASTLTNASASDAEVCAAGRTFLNAVMGLAEPSRTTILRYLIASL